MLTYRGPGISPGNVEGGVRNFEKWYFQKLDNHVFWFQQVCIERQHTDTLLTNLRLLVILLWGGGGVLSSGFQLISNIYLNYNFLTDNLQIILCLKKIHRYFKLVSFSTTVIQLFSIPT